MKLVGKGLVSIVSLVCGLLGLLTEPAGAEPAARSQVEIVIEDRRIGISTAESPRLEVYKKEEADLDYVLVHTFQPLSGGSHIINIKRTDSWSQIVLVKLIWKNGQPELSTPDVTRILSFRLRNYFLPQKIEVKAVYTNDKRKELTHKNILALSRQFNRGQLGASELFELFFRAGGIADHYAERESGIRAHIDAAQIWWEAARRLSLYNFTPDFGQIVQINEEAYKGYSSLNHSNDERTRLEREKRLLESSYWRDLNLVNPNRREDFVRNCGIMKVLVEWLFNHLSQLGASAQQDYDFQFNGGRRSESPSVFNERKALVERECSRSPR